MLSSAARYGLTTGLSHSLRREMAAHLTREEGITVSHSVVADLWRDHDLKPHQAGTFKLSTPDPNVEAKDIDVVGLYRRRGLGYTARGLACPLTVREDFRYVFKPALTVRRATRRRFGAPASGPRRPGNARHNRTG